MSCRTRLAMHNKLLGIGRSDELAAGLLSLRPVGLRAATFCSRANIDRRGKTLPGFTHKDSVKDNGRTSAARTRPIPCVEDVNNSSAWRGNPKSLKEQDRNGYSSAIDNNKMSKMTSVFIGFIFMSRFIPGLQEQQDCCPRIDQVNYLRLPLHGCSPNATAWVHAPPGV